MVTMNPDDDHAPTGKACRPSGLGVAAGVFLVVLAVYVLANPGRIDLIDGQVRYEVALNWLTAGRPMIMDLALLHLHWGITGRRGFSYAGYGAAASEAAMPLVWIGLFYDDPPGEASRFLFSLTGSIFGAPG